MLTDHYHEMVKRSDNRHYWASYIQRPWHHLKTWQRPATQFEPAKLETLVAWEEVISVNMSAGVIIGLFANSSSSF